MNKLENKVAVITGGSGGIGFATAKLFLAEGARVLLVDRDEKTLTQVCHSLGSQSAKYCVADVSKTSDVKNYVAAAIQHFGAIDILFDNAGIEGHASTLVDMSEEDFDRVLSVNIKGAWLGLKYCAPEMMKRGGGSIMITSSVAGLRGSPNLGHYVTSKHAVIGLMRSAAIELGPKKIRVNTINPGPINNRMMRSIEEQFAPGAGAQVKAGFELKIPLGRYGENEEVAKLALFLSSSDSEYLTGGTYVVDGGYTAG
ncbi:MAG: SDR family NAD(P)-dependent oxidoreductase [Bdellovibrionales bacterium]